MTNHCEQPDSDLDLLIRPPPEDFSNPAPLGGAITRVLGIEPHGYQGRKGYDLSELYGYLEGCVDRQAGV